jgi:hypothetical protein
MDKIITKTKCLFLTGHNMEKFQSTIVDGIFGKAEAYRTKCANCEYVEKFWVIKEKNRHLVRSVELLNKKISIC